MLSELLKSYKFKDSKSYKKERLEMTNNLKGIRKGLCAFAKRCKEFKYTDSALITFLVTGAVSISSNLFSAETDIKLNPPKMIWKHSFSSI